MHDPLVVAFEIRRPWPTRRDSRGWRYWPPLVTVWHREPGGADALTICRHDSHWRWHAVHIRWQALDVATHDVGGTVHHRIRYPVLDGGWRIQVPPLQALRRRLLTRCAWCGGPTRKGDPVNVAHSWDGPRGHWWAGEPGLHHRDCSSVARAHSLCLCTDPLLPPGGYGTCALCGRSRAWRQQPDDADRLLAALPAGSRISSELRPQIEAAWAARRPRATT